MSLVFLAYLIGVIPVIHDSLSVVFILSALFVAGAFIAFLTTYDSAFRHENRVMFREKTILTMKRSFIVGSIAFALQMFIPNENTAKLMIGAHIVQKGYEEIINIEGVDRLPENAVKYINNFFEGVKEHEQGAGSQ